MTLAQIGANQSILAEISNFGGGMMIATYVAVLGIMGWFIVTFYNTVQNFTRAIAIFEEAIKRIDVRNELQTKNCEQHWKKTGDIEGRLNRVLYDLVGEKPRLKKKSDCFCEDDS